MVECDDAELVIVPQLLYHELQGLLQEREVILHATTARK